MAYETELSKLNEGDIVHFKKDNEYTRWRVRQMTFSYVVFEKVTVGHPTQKILSLKKRIAYEVVD